MAFPTDWSKKHKITVDVSTLSLAGTLANYPYLLNVDAFLAEIWSNSDNGGGDIRFSSDLAGSTQLPCEVVRWDTSGSASEVHVKLPSLGTSTTDLYVWYDNTGTTQPARDATYGSDNVWTDYEGVYHLQGTSTDSSANAYNLTDTNSPTTNATGKIQTAFDYERSGTQYSTIADASCPNLEISGAQYWSGWAKTETLGIGQHIAGKNNAPASVNHDLFINSDNKAYFRLQGLTTTSILASSGTVVANTFYHIAGMYDSSASRLKVFINGTKTEGTASGTTTDTNGAFSVGHAGQFTATSQFDGILDEVRVRNGAVSDDWVKTDYSTQNSPSTYVTPTALSISESFVDSLGLTDNLVTTTTYHRSIGDSVGLSDKLNVGLLLERALTDSMGLSDSLTTSFIFNVSLTDSMGLSDALSTVNTYSRSLVDDLGLSDELDSVLTIEISLVDSMGMTDAVNAGILLNRALVDSMGMTDAVSTAERILKQSIVKLEEILDIKIKFDDILDIKIELEDIDDK